MAMRFDSTINWPTLLAVGGVAVGLVMGWATFDFRLEKLETYRTEHEASIRERREANELRFRTVEKATDENEAAGKSNTFRVTALEVAAPRIDANITELQRAINDLSGDTRVIKEILQRIEAAQTANAAAARAEAKK
jgi:hypothetical protein